MPRLPDSGPMRLDALSPDFDRAFEELLSLKGAQVAASGADAWNPVFDVTPASLIDVLVTEIGVVRQPTTESMRALMANR